MAAAVDRVKRFSGFTGEAKQGRFLPMSDVADLPDDVEALKAMLRDAHVEISRHRVELRGRDLLIEKLKLQLSGMARHRFGSSSKARPVFDDLISWLQSELPKISGKSDLAKAIRYVLTRLPRLEVYLSNGHLEIDNNAAERGMRGLAIGRKNWLFAGSEGGGHAAAIAYTLIETARLNDVDPQAWLTHILSRIADHPINRVADLAAWNFPDRSARDNLVA